MKLKDRHGTEKSVFSNPELITVNKRLGINHCHTFRFISFKIQGVIFSGGTFNG